MENKNPEMKIEYICGKCGSINEISLDDEIVCTYCFYNILFKKRTIQVKKVKAI